MARDKRRRLEATVRALRARWGPRAVGRTPEVLSRTTPAVVSTGFPALDRALGMGGLPRGHITEILGQPTSGMATLALKALAQAQATGEAAVIVDLAHAFDGEYAARCGVDVTRVLLARPANAQEALDLVHTLVQRQAAGLVLFDSVADLKDAGKSARGLEGALQRVQALLKRTATVLIFLTPLWGGPTGAASPYPQRFPLPQVAAVRLHITRQAWVYRGRRLYGWEARVQVVKNRFGPTGRAVTVAITFPRPL